MGFATASWFVEKGFTRIALVSRRPPTESEQASIDRLSDFQNIAFVRVYIADVGDYNEMKEVIAEITSDPEMAPLVGVVHSALVLKDELVRNATVEDFNAVIKPRLYGAHNLHDLTKDLPLSFFVLYSSISAYYGVPGQSNYNATNTFFDALAQMRSLMGLPSFSFGLPSISGVGYVDRLQFIKNLQQKGLTPIFYRAALNLLEHISCWTPYRSQFVVFDAERLIVPHLNSVLKELFVKKRTSVKQNNANTEDIGTEEFHKKRIVLGVAKLLGVDSNLLTSKPLVEYGVDSLTSMDIQNWIQKNYHTHIKISEILAGATIQTLTEKILANNKIVANNIELVGQPPHQPTPTLTSTQTKPHPHKPTSFPVSPFQEGVLMQTMFYGTTKSSFNVTVSSKVSSSFSTLILQRAVDVLVQRHKLFFAKFSFSEGICQMQLAPFTPGVYQVEQHNTTSFEMIRMLTDLAYTEFDLLGGGPLARFAIVRVADDPKSSSSSPSTSFSPPHSTTHAILLVSVSHMICDAHSLAVVHAELNTLYNNLAENPTVHYNTALLPRIEMEFTEITEKQLSRLPQFIQQQLPFWKRELISEIPDLFSLYRNQHAKDDKVKRGSAIMHILSPTILDRISKLAATVGKTLFSLWCTGIVILLHHYTNIPDICFGISTTDRPQNASHTLASLINTVVVRTTINPLSSTSELIKSVASNIIAALSNKDIPYSVLQSQLGLARNVNARPLYQVLITQPASFTSLFEDNNIIFVPPKVVYHELCFQILPKGSIVIEYATDIFSENAITRMMNQLEQIYAKMTDNASLSIRELSLVSEAEKQLIEEWNGGADFFGSEFSSCVHVKFELQAMKTPHMPALVSNDSITTYHELNQMADHISTLLQERTCKGLIALYLEKSVYQVAAIIGVLKAGCAYIPLDPQDNLLRIKQLLHHSGTNVVVTTAKLAERLSEHGPDIRPIFVDQEKSHTIRAPVICNEENMFCVIYTSGSTGQPKGVVIPHSVPAFRVEWDPFPRKEEDVFCFRTSYCFIDSIWEIFAPLTHGNKLAIPPPCAANDVHLLAESLSQHKVTRLIVVPTLLDSLLTESLFPNLATQLPYLAIVESTGEPLPTSLAKKFVEKLPGRTLVNMYGLSETWDSCYKIIQTFEDLSDSPLVSLGTTAKKAFNLILNDLLLPTPIGIYGQLAIGGYGIASGYLNNEAQTKTKFVEVTHRGQKTRVFLTGDQARFNEKGEIEYQGRVDTQFKLNGITISPNEIESVLTQHPEVSQAVVGKVNNQLVAAIVLKRKDRKLSQAEQCIREYLQQSLPSYHIPSFYAFLDDLPLLPNGKRNRAQISATVEKLMHEQSCKDIAYPSTNAEFVIYYIWKSFLPGDFGITDNFFSLGGNSIIAKSIWKKIKDLFNASITFPVFIQFVTIKELAAAVTSKETMNCSTSITTVPLKSSGSKPPLFCVHPASGLVYMFYSIAEYLADIPFYGLQSSQLMERAEGVKFESVEQLAEKYISDMIAIQPSGPYYISGYSFGGIVAYEMAQQLQKRNVKVASLILFDTWPPIKEQTYEEIHTQQIQTIQNYFSIYTESHFNWIVELYKMYIESAQKYEIQPLSNIPVILLQARESNPQKYTHWEKLVDNLRIEEISGQHLTIFSKENAKSLGLTVQTLLEGLYQQ